MIDFVINFLDLTNKKGKSYNLILVIVNWQTKIVYYKSIKVTIDKSDLAKVIFNVIA